MYCMGCNICIRIHMYIRIHAWGVIYNMYMYMYMYMRIHACDVYMTERNMFYIRKNMFYVYIHNTYIYRSLRPRTERTSFSFFSFYIYRSLRPRTERTCSINARTSSIYMNTYRHIYIHTDIYTYRTLRDIFAHELEKHVLYTQ